MQKYNLHNEGKFLKFYQFAKTFLFKFATDFANEMF